MKPPHFSEDQMADIVIARSEELLGEPLTLLERKFWIGRYELDLLFEDRHGGRLIVELERGPLDRYHLYKVLDYYDEYKDRNPTEFVEVMVVANTISPERKQRLAARGVNFREIPDALISHALATGAGHAPSASTPEQAQVEVPNGTPLPDELLSFIKRTADSAAEAYSQVLRQRGYAVDSGRPLSEFQIQPVVDEVRENVRRESERQLRVQNEGADWTPFRVRVGLELADLVGVWSQRLGEGDLPADRRLLQFAENGTSQHLELLLKPGVSSWVETQLPEIVRALGAEKVDPILFRVLTSLPGESPRQWRIARERDIRLLVDEALNRPDLVRQSCSLIRSWVIATEGLGSAEVGAELFIWLQRLIANVCGEVIWRLSFRLHGTREVLVGLDSTGAFVSRPYELPWDSKQVLSTFMRLAFFWCLPEGVARLWKPGDRLAESARVSRRACFERGSSPWPDRVSIPQSCATVPSAWSLSTPASIPRSGRRFDRSPRS